MTSFIRTWVPSAATEHRDAAAETATHPTSIVDLVADAAPSARHLEAFLLKTLERCGAGVLLVMSDGSILVSNRQAKMLMVKDDGLRVRNGQLTARTREETDRLDTLIRAACGAGEGAHPEGVMLLSRGTRRALSILVAPFRCHLVGYPGAGAIVFVRDPETPMTATKALGTLFQLTPTEARIAQAMANGRTIEDIAATHRSNTQTVRKQVKSILAKTGTHRQTDCVVVILRSIVGFATE